MLEILRNIVQEVGAEADLHQAMTILVNRIRDAIAVDVCSVYLIDQRSDELVLVANEGLRAGSIGKVRLRPGEGVVGLVAERAEPLNLADDESHQRYHYVEMTGESAYHGFMAVPVIFSRRVLGVLVVQRREQRAFSEDEVSLMVTLAAQMAGIIAQIEVEKYLSEAASGEARQNIILKGTDGIRGVSVGQAVTVRGTRRLRNTPDRCSKDPQAEMERFRTAVDMELDELDRQRERLRGSIPGADLELFDAYALILRGDSLSSEVERRIASGNWAPGALRDTIAAHARAFEKMDDPYLRGRAADLRDLGERLLRSMQHGAVVTREYPPRVVLVGEEITVGDFVDVPEGRLAALVSVRGTAASHVALLARGIGVPWVFGVASLPVSRLEGCEIAVDGYSARVCIQPAAALREEYLRLESQEQALSRDLESLRDKESVTTDGVRVPLLANTALFADVAAARHGGAEGIGLYRSEMHFSIRDRFPGEEEQTAIYRRVIRTFPSRPVSLRTLDIGGDKQLSYFPIHEDNPYLGWRGVRVSLDHPELFLTQLRAMLRAGTERDHYRILFPMITRLDELDECLELLKRARKELREDGLPAGDPEVGMMVEVPAVVFQIGEYASRVRHLALGTNDLTQYLLATDRNNERVAHLYDPLHPALLRSVDQVVQGARPHGCQVSACGEAAGDPPSALLLIGLGVEILSMGHASLNNIKWLVRNLSRERAASVASRALTMSHPWQVRELVERELEDIGLGGLIRAGR